MNKMIDLVKKHRELIVYGIFGVLTTLVDFLSFYVFVWVLGIEDNLSNVISQILAIIFAFITNKIFVFKDKKKSVRDILSQFIKFFSMRFISLLVNSGLYWIFVDLLHVNKLLTKASVAILIIILNYIFSKLFIFKKD